MKIFVVHSSNFDFVNDLYLPLRKSKLNLENEIILPQEKGKDVITKQTIKSCDVIIAEVSHPSTGQGIELGWADIFKIPVICIYKETGQVSSSSLEKITNVFIAYKDKQDMIKKIKKALANLKTTKTRIDKKDPGGILNNKLTEKEKSDVEKAVKKTVDEYGETLRLLAAT